MVAFNQYCQKVKQLALRAACIVMVTVIMLSGAWTPSAMAVGSEKAAAVVNDRAAAELDRVSGAGTSERLEGAAQSTIGKAKRGTAELTDGISNSVGDKLDRAENKLEGATDELSGKIKRDVGRAKGAAADTAADAKGNAKGVVESIKDLFR